ncbi:hypothetical protein GDO86_013520 [Hymenochirus boettgeri]|uniref:Taste receptor type 2 n=1 Tax=Hymenochirus boettgeri TaxID=247094 RepID=A0A8T2IZN9_9PIPI|nr:hypothetical protein GDO86_013520 [Hymenochirus boettgeri]
MGIAGNLLILVSNFMEWRRTKDITPYVIILSSIGISNILLQLMTLANQFCIQIQKDFQEIVILSFIAIMTSLALTSLLFSLCLCFFYCVKIIQINNTLFLKLKKEIPRTIPLLLTLSVLVSLSVGMFSYWDLYQDHVSNANVSSTEPSVDLNIKSKCQCFFVLLLALSSVALTIFFSLSLAIIISLYRHMRKMKNNRTTEACKAGLDVHISAAKTLTLLLLLYISFFVELCVLLDISETYGHWYFVLCYILASAFPTLSSLVLIMGNSKLKNSVKIILQILCAGCKKQSNHKDKTVRSSLHPDIRTVTGNIE